MFRRSEGAARRPKIGKAIVVMLLALSAAGCDRCGGILPPTKWLHFDPQLDACRETSPRPQ